MNIKKFALILLSVTISHILFAEQLRDTFGKNGLVFEPVQIQVQNLKRSYTFVWISDLHVIADDISEVAPKSQPGQRRKRDKRFNNIRSGMKPSAVWKKLPGLLNGFECDAVFFGGDICDVGSIANLTVLKDGFKQLKKPFIYLREDHDMTPWCLANKDTAEQQRISKEIDGHPAVPFIEYDDLIVVGIDNNITNVTAEALAEFKKHCAKNKPVIVLLHVPINAKDNISLNLLRKEDRRYNHMWRAFMRPDQNTRDLISLITDKNSPVKAVFAGHLHFSWDGMLSPGVRQHIFAPAYEGNIGLITITPSE